MEPAGRLDGDALEPERAVVGDSEARLRVLKCAPAQVVVDVVADERSDDDLVGAVAGRLAVEDQQLLIGAVSEAGEGEGLDAVPVEAGDEGLGVADTVAPGLRVAEEDEPPEPRTPLDRVEGPPLTRRVDRHVREEASPSVRPGKAGPVPPSQQRIGLGEVDAVAKMGPRPDPQCAQRQLGREESCQESEHGQAAARRRGEPPTSSRAAAHARLLLRLGVPRVAHRREGVARSARRMRGD